MNTKTNSLNRKFGLIGKNISYSFSQSYFTKKFERENIKNTTYQNFDIPAKNKLKPVLSTRGIVGLNVTIPYKEVIITHLDKIDSQAEEIGAVNTIKIDSNGKTKGYNTDCYGFKKALIPYLKTHHKMALILGTGGASKAVAYALKQMGISYKMVSRHPEKDQLNYKDLTKTIIVEHKIIINCTPLGTSPNIKTSPDIPYIHITDNHILYDLIYNPKETLFLTKAIAQGATAVNGLKMLEYQAEKAWEIWNS
jgi:shikimate dehydrogenase